MDHKKTDKHEGRSQEPGTVRFRRVGDTDSWWLLRRVRQTRIVQSAEQPQIPDDVKPGEIQVIGPFATEEKAQKHRERVTSRIFDAEDKGEGL